MKRQMVVLEITLQAGNRSPGICICAMKSVRSMSRKHKLTSDKYWVGWENGDITCQLYGTYLRLKKFCEAEKRVAGSNLTIVNSREEIP